MWNVSRYKVENVGRQDKNIPYVLSGYYTEIAKPPKFTIIFPVKSKIQY